MPKVLSQSEKRRIIIFLCLTGIFSLIFGIFYIKFHLSNTFIEQVKSRTLSYKEERVKKLAELKSKDSDKDGLWDYDELYQYNTSPYLADSDSDGYTDKEEIESGNDPNCLAGHVCEQERVDINTNQEISSEAVAAQELLTKGSAEMTPDQVRNILRQTGASETMLAEIDDETLMNLFAETVSETGISPEELNRENIGKEVDYKEFLNTGQITADSFEKLTNLTPQQIRDLLLAAGADPQALDEVDDETLQAIYLEALAEEQFAIPKETPAE